MAINFPSTAGQATDGSYTYTVAGIVYSWNGESWEAAGAGASATDRTLFSVNQNAASGGGSLAYNNNSGVFDYTPPDLSSYLTAEADTLSTVVARGNTTGGDIRFGDGQKLILGSDLVTNDLELYHGGALDNHGYVTSNTGNLYLKSGVSGAVHLVGFNQPNLIVQSTSVQIKYNNSIKLETSNTGVTVTGALTAGGLTYPTTNGTSGQVLTSDGGGNVTWATPSGLQSRTTAQATQSIANNAAANVSFTTPKTYALLSIQTNVAAWVTLYMDTTSRTNDASRGETTDPVPGSGVLAEAITAGSTTQYITPGAVCFNSAGTGITYAKIVNKSGGTANVTVTLNYVQLEA